MAACVIVDVFYDHVLTRRWPEHRPRPLSVYTQEVYRTLRDNLHRTPAAVHPLIDAMSWPLTANLPKGARVAGKPADITWLSRFSSSPIFHPPPYMPPRPTCQARW